MERYTLNETPLAGAALMFGRGAAAQSLIVGGAGHLVMQGRPAPAAMTVLADGDGVLAQLGRGTANMSMSAAGRAYLIMRGLARAALLALDALGNGAVIPAARGVAAMTMTALGRGMNAVRGSSAADLLLGAQARGTVAKLGAGLADLVMTGSAGIPRPFKLPSRFSRAHASRQVRVPHASITRELNGGDRTTAVEREHRTIIVAPERNP
jgi:hypothetical protein